MPPAFNLSQDQTLQFNLCLLAFLPPYLTAGVAHSKYWPLLIAEQRISFLWTFDNLSNQRPKSLAPSSNAHTYRLLIFKELYSVHLAVGGESFCSLQQRREIMLCFLILVNSFFSLRLRFLCRPCSRNHLITLTFSVSAEAEANYNKPKLYCARALHEYSLKCTLIV